MPGCQLFDNIAEQGIAIAAKFLPNPTSNVLNVHFTSVAVPTGTFYMHDLHGQEVHRFEPHSRNTNYTLDLRHLVSGMYLLAYKDKGGCTLEGEDLCGTLKQEIGSNQHLS